MDGPHGTGAVVPEPRRPGTVLVRPPASIRTNVLELAARICAAARVLVRHGHTLNADEGDKLLAEIDEAAGVLQDGVSTLVRLGARDRTDAA